MAKKNVYVIGHKNPDTDSICSALAYSWLKNAIAKRDGLDYSYIPARAGHVNEETQYVLNHFQVEAPVYVADIRPQVSDLDFNHQDGIDENLSLKNAWYIMRRDSIVSLPILEGEKLKGIITVGDIAYSNMDVYDNRIVSDACTSYKNIVETIDGSMIVGDMEGYFEDGKILIGAANLDVMENFIEPRDLVILSNRYEAQLCAIEMDAQCIIIATSGADVSKTIRRMALDHDCRIIVTPYDTYTTARLLNHSIPVKHFMSSKDLTTFATTDFIEDVSEVMAKKRFRDFPIVDGKGNYVGMMSRRNLLDLDRKKMILVDHNEKTQAVDGFEDAEILEIIDHHRLGNIETTSPVFFRNQPVGCTATIVTQMYMENNIEIPPHIAGLLLSAILSDTLMFRSPTCTPIDQMVAEKLAGIAEIDIEEHATNMFDAGSNLRSKTANEIFYQDFKKFNDGKINFGVGQISSMNSKELSSCTEKLLPYMEEVRSSQGLDMVMFMMTNIITETTELLMVGDMCKEVIEPAFNVKAGDHSAELAGVVSRKKQLIPAILNNLPK
jgi:manganese-dependent inorganic pyrophosphatase